MQVNESLVIVGTGIGSILIAAVLAYFGKIDGMAFAATVAAFTSGSAIASFRK